MEEESGDRVCLFCNGSGYLNITITCLFCEKNMDMSATSCAGCEKYKEHKTEFKCVLCKGKGYIPWIDTMF